MIFFVESREFLVDERMRSNLDSTLARSGEEQLNASSARSILRLTECAPAGAVRFLTFFGTVNNGQVVDSTHWSSLHDNGLYRM